MQRDLAFTRRFRSEAERVQEERRRQDPDYQGLVRRREAMHTLLGESFSPEHVDAMQALPEFRQYLNEQRAEAANRDLDDALKEVGLVFEDSKEGRELRQIYEDAISAPLKTDRALNARYFGTPADRREVIRELVAREERRTNHALALQGAQTLREYAARQARLPRGMRQAPALPVVREEKPTATDPTLRRREGNQIASRQLDDIWNHTR